jgi:succinate-semialdehyde dehydrogenase/glutarate-semialdehyde dehydrogenase
MTYQTTNPFTEQVLATFPQHTNAELDSMLALASQAFTRDWRVRSYRSRGAIMNKAVAILRERRDEFARLATLEMGKRFREAQEEVDLPANILEYYANNAEAFLAPRILEVASGESAVQTSPLGTLFCVEPWNFPYYQLARVAGPNLMAGNTLMVKHAPNVPQCALAFEKLFLDAGAPKGVYINVFLSNEQAATAIADRRIAGVALTGSERAGSAVASEAGKALKKSTMELGGSDAFIVLDDADLDIAVEQGVTGRMTNSGQVCNAAKRFILDESIADAFLARFTAELSRLIPGDPMESRTTLAPLCSAQALTTVLKQIKLAVESGAKLLLGGKRPARSGFFLEPCVFHAMPVTDFTACRSNISRDAGPGFHGMSVQDFTPCRPGFHEEASR